MRLILCLQWSWCGNQNLMFIALLSIIKDIYICLLTHQEEVYLVTHIISCDVLLKILFWEIGRSVWYMIKLSLGNDLIYLLIPYIDYMSIGPRSILYHISLFSTYFGDNTNENKLDDDNIVNFFFIVRKFKISIETRKVWFWAVEFM